MQQHGWWKRTVQCLVILFASSFVRLSAGGVLLGTSPKDTILPDRPLFHKIDGMIAVDGVLNELEWGAGSLNSNFFEHLPRGWNGKFHQYFPYDTSLSETRTAFKLLYSYSAIYIGIVCENRNPSKKFVINGLKRDFSVTNTDGVVVTLSTFNDGQNGFSFGLSPYNTQREGSVENGGGFGVTTAWDQVWFSETSLQNGYWVAEIMVPLKSIRFVPGVKEWSVNVSRFDLKNNEISNFSRVPRNFNVSTLVFAKPVGFSEGSSPNKKSRNLVLIPYASGNGFQEKVGSPRSFVPKVGLDAKVGLSKSLNMDITANPDFAQVDVDVQQINLTRFSLFYPERRQFFIENSDLFATFGFRQIRPFFSRRIGLAAGGTVPILAGVRVSGKLGTDWRLGAMNISTAGVAAWREKPMNYSVFALQKKVFAASTVGIIAVHDRKMDTSGDYNTVLGLEYNLLSKDSRWGGKAFIQKSDYQGLAMNEGFAHASWFRYRDLRWFLMWNHEYVSKDFRARTGFVPRIANFDTTGKIVLYDYWRLEPEIKRTWYPKGSKLLNNYSLMAYNSSYYDSAFGMTESESELGLDFSLQNSAVFHFSVDNSYQRLFLPFKPFDDLPAFFGEYRWWSIHSELTTNNRKPVYCYARMTQGGYFTGKKSEFAGELFYRLPALGKSQLPKWVLSANWNRVVVRDDQGGGDAVNLLGLKAEHSFNTICYLTSYFQYNSQAERMNINIRFQWRYRPMSDVFIVLSQNWNQFPQLNTVESYYWSVRSRSVAVKWVYWLNR